MNDFQQNQNFSNNPQNPPEGSSYPNAAQNGNNGWGAPNNYGVPVGNPYDPNQPQQQQQQQYSASSGWQQTPNAKPPKPPKKHTGVKIFLGSIACILTISIVGFAGYGVYSMASNKLAPALPIPKNESASSIAEPIPGINLQDVPRVETKVPTDGKLTTEQLVDKVAPSVVAILIYNNGYTGGPIGMGSGIIIREDGYIVTNAHVVESADGLVVQRNNGESLEARVVGMDKQTDLAVIKVDATGLPAAEFGNSDQVKVGEKVIAIGNPRSMSFYGTVTQGIVSGLNRQLSAVDEQGGSVTNYTDLIQTDAAINSGNSGGALVNEYGQVIGINAAKAGAAGVEGLGFAIPSNDAKTVTDDLINVGHVTGRVLLGITTRGAVNAVEARNANLPAGVWVSSTNQDSDISKKGVLPGDIITKIDDTDIKTLADIQVALKDKKPGDTVNISIYRAPMPNGSKKTGSFTVAVQVMEDTGTPAEPSTDVAPQQELPQYDGGAIDPFEYFFGQFN